MIIHELDHEGRPSTVVLQTAPHVPSDFAHAVLLTVFDRYPHPYGYVLHDSVRMVYQLPGDSEEWLTLDALVERAKPRPPPPVPEMLA